jgi:carbamoyltransferase
MYTLGINAAFHDSSAAILRDGLPIAAAEDERFTRIKHGKRPVPFLSYQLPFHAIDYCLREAGIPLSAVDHIAYSFDPSLALDGIDPETISLPLEPSAKAREDGRHPWEPLFLAGIVNAPRFLLDDVPHHLRGLRADIQSRDQLPPFHFVEHHMAHAASTYFVSGFDQAAVLTMDGRGEQASTVFSVGDGANLSKVDEVRLPHSLGLLYERATSHLGFLHSSDEYKVMALASYGSDRFFERFRRFVEVMEDGRYEIERRLCDGVWPGKRAWGAGGAMALRPRGSPPEDAGRVCPGDNPALPRTHRPRRPVYGRRSGPQLRDERPSA